MKKHWLYYITPCILASLLALVFTIMGLVDSNYSGGNSVILVFFLLPALLVLLLADWLVKSLTKGKLLYIWIIELILVVIGLMCLSQFRMGGC